MSFREPILLRIRDLLQPLKIQSAQTKAGKDGRLYLQPNVGYGSPLRDVVLRPLEGSSEKSTDTPIAHVSFDGGRNDGPGAYITHTLETLGIRIDVVFNEKIGVEEITSQGSKVRELPLQIADFLSDVTTLVTLSDVATAVHDAENDLLVESLYLEEWTLDPTFRGSSKEVLSLVFQIQVGHPITP